MENTKKITEAAREEASRLCDFLNASPVNFLAAMEVCRQLTAAGFTELDPREAWTLKPGAKHFIVKNGSAVMAFVAGEGGAQPFRIISAHTDSPGFRLKPDCEMITEGGVIKLNTEVYGGPILYTWFDRPLSMAGRVIVRSADPFNPEWRTVDFKRPLLVIPHIAIHFKRDVNDGNKISRQIDMLPVIACDPELAGKGLIRTLVAKELNIAADDILDWDLSLYPTEPATLIGLDEEFVSSGRLDDLSMVHAGLEAMLATADVPCKATRVLALFDNEETGSGTKQGAASPVLDSLLRRINACLGGDDETYFRRVAASFMVSADDAHALHPNHPELHDPTNHPLINNGPVIKINANCKYMTDADSAAVFAEICRKAGVEPQYFVNRSDSAGGSTLGNILTSQIDLRGVDMGAPIWAMHSCRETAGVYDHHATIRAFREFFA